MNFSYGSFTDSHQELTDHIVPKEYYDRYPLVFSHYHLDRIIVRIGMNGKQRQKYENQYRAFQVLRDIGEGSTTIQGDTSSARGKGRFANSEASFGQIDDSCAIRLDLPRGTDYLQQQIITSKIPASQNLLN